MFGGLAALTISLPIPAAGAGCTLQRVSAPKGADLRVYFTRFPSEDTSNGKYAACKIVKAKKAETKTFYVTPFRQDATVVVLRKNWPK